MFSGYELVPCDYQNQDLDPICQTPNHVSKDIPPPHPHTHILTYISIQVKLVVKTASNSISRSFQKCLESSGLNPDAFLWKQYSQFTRASFERHHCLKLIQRTIPASPTRWTLLHEKDWGIKGRIHKAKNMLSPKIGCHARCIGVGWGEICRSFWMTVTGEVYLRSGSLWR